MPERLVLPIHGADHCPGGPDPIPCLGDPTGWMYAIWGNSTKSLASGVWGQFTEAADGSPWFEYFISDPNPASFAFDPSLGILTWDPDWLVEITAQTLFGDTFSSGDTVGVGLNLGVAGSFTGDRQVNITPIKTPAGDSGEWNTIHAHSQPSFSAADSARVEGWQTSGGAKLWADARITAHSVRRRAPGTFTNP